MEGDINLATKHLKKLYLKGAEPKQVLEDMLKVTYSLISALATNSDDQVYEKEKFDPESI